MAVKLPSLKTKKKEKKHLKEIGNKLKPGKKLGKKF